MELVADTFLLYKVNEHQCSCLVCAVSLIICLCISCKNRIGNRKFHSKLPIIVLQIKSIILIESEEFRETLISTSRYLVCGMLSQLQFSQTHKISNIDLD